MQARRERLLHGKCVIKPNRDMVQRSVKSTAAVASLASMRNRIRNQTRADEDAARLRSALSIAKTTSGIKPERYTYRSAHCLTY